MLNTEKFGLCDYVRFSQIWSHICCYFFVALTKIIFMVILSFEVAFVS